MLSRHPAKSRFSPLLDLIERRFEVRIPEGSMEHLRTIREHYLAKRKMLLWEHGSAVIALDDYAKAVLISETAHLMLREIDPWPRRKKNKGNKHGK
jgi:hypothetical protein